MNKDKENIFEKKYIWSYIFILHLIFIFIAYGMFLNIHFSVDSYNLIYDTKGSHFLISGRVITYFITQILYRLNINLTLDQQYFFVFFIISIAISSTSLVKLILSKFTEYDIKKFITINLAVLLSFINVFFLEWFLYPESTIFFAIGLLSTVISIYAITQQNKLINIIISFVCLAVAMGIYQANLSIFIIYALTVCMIKEDMKFNKEYLKNSFVILCIGFFNSVLTLVILKIIKIFELAPESERAPNLTFSIIKENIIQILKAQKLILNDAYGLLPEYSIFIMLLILAIISVILIRKKRVSIKQITLIILFLIINYLIIFAPHFFTSTLWLAQRTIIGFFMFISIIIVLIAYNSNNKNIILVLLLSISVFTMVNFMQIQNIGVNHIASNKLDREYSLIINNQIKQYEKENNIKIKYIATKNDVNPTYNYNDIKYTIFDTNVRAFVTAWADVNMINYFTSENYIKIPMDIDIYNNYFKDKDWTYFKEDEQMIFIGETLYLMLY